MKFFSSLIILLLIFGCEPKSTSDYEADLIIYGGTSAAITAAIQAKKMGKSVIVVSPDIHLGGLSSSGLGYTDTGNKSVIGGLAREFYHRVYMHYQTDSAWKWQKKEEYGNQGQGTPAMDGENRTMWIFEPHVAEQVFEDLAREYEMVIHRDEWLDREAGVTKENGQITQIKTRSGKTYRGKVFIDATYEGDLMAAAGVSYHVGREANSVYDEKWNGVQVGIYQHRHYFQNDISPYVIEGDSTSGLLPEISADPPGENGDGDSRIQAYNYRMALSRHPDNRVPFAKPQNYDPARYELLARVYAAGWDETFEKFDPIPNLKTDTNNHGPFSTDYIGKNYAYPEASYEERKQIVQENTDYQQGLMYYLANDSKVPQEVRDEMAQWGLAKDEFVDNGNWPHQIYVREARRMIGAYVMTEHDVLGAKTVPEPVGMGSYSLDSHNTQRFVTKDGFVQNEGDIGVHPEKPYSISLGTLLPKKEECTNLLVPVCVSSSHTAFGSIRMEPVFMILGQSAAAVASLAIDQEIAVQDLSYADLEVVLDQENQILTQK
ncbi:FAD-dependent oxidoreductase [Algoriphagus sp. D3-2-R+10]|uniref:FAD-dependent oxidoreductase n=1 Tax=Algoriphagus aurantiacus TaxID=3103948 RepID=UPI002B3C0EE1|nr:FAD-dependent oxidoreductase [Algoriphagus sp. D3-2-R+10]MEB2777685.1 FAD-dependent oxidoreductase [Algoriphagus sp. D3-2-R+10]